MRAKKMALPTSRFDETVAEIVELLDKGDSDKFATEIVVRSTIQFLKTAQKKPLWGFKKSNTDALSALQKNIGDLRETLRAMPSEMLVLLAIETLPDENLPEEVPSFPGPGDVAIERLKKIVAMLGYLQARCDQLLDRRPGEHPNVKFSQRMIAEEAWRLIESHMLKPASGVASSAYGSIASLLFEAVTGEPDKDLQRACKDVLKRAKKGEFREWKGPTIFKGRLPT